MRAGVAFTDIEVFRHRLRVEDARALLSQLDQTEVLEFCALLNAVNEVAVGPGIAWTSQKHVIFLERLLHDLLTPVYHARARRLVAASQPFVPLVGTALRALMKLVCVWCPPTGGKHLESSRFRQNVTKVLFALQGAMLADTPVVEAEESWVHQAFPGVTRCVLCNPRLNLRHDIARLHAIVSRPEVGDLLAQREGGRTINDWFRERFGLTSGDYRRVAQGLACYAGQFNPDAPHPAQLWLDLDAFCKCFPGEEQAVARLVQLATTTPEEVKTGAKSEYSSFSDVLFDANDLLLLQPLLQVGGRHLVTSFDGVFGKFVRGLPYLAMAAAERAGLTGTALQAARAPVGYIFEGYASWLAAERFRGSSARVIKNYRIKPEHLPRGHTDPERDLLLILGEVGFSLEVKAKVPPRSLRATGDLRMMAELVKGLSRQAVTAADALVKGSCCDEDGKQIAPLRKVYPAVLVFDHFPAKFPFSDAFEGELEKQLQRHLFRDAPDIGPLQVFDIDSYEDWDKAYRLPEEAIQLFHALQERASAPWLRYESLIELRKQKDGIQPSWNSIVDKLCDESEALLCTTKT